MDKNWSIETVQETAANNWSLEGDNQLLNLMKSISKNLEQRCMTSNNNLNRLMLDVDKTKIKLGNATTKLLDLSNGKFVEHTVMDMDVPVANTEKGTPAENEKAFVSLPKAVEEAVTNGLNMMDRCYEKVLLNLEDSDDEEENDSGQKHVVCRPKDPYLNRPLPHLIGSKQWNDKWHVGLIESDEEVLSDEEPQEFSQSSSDEGDSLSNSPRTSNPPTTSESDFTVPAPAVNHHEDLFHRLSDDGETKSPLFAPDENKYQERVKVLPTVKPSIQGHVGSEPVNKPKQLTEPPVPVLEQPKQSVFVQQKTEPKFLNLFDDEPPSLEEPIRHERKPVNLFLDSDDEDDRPTTDAQKPTSIFNNNNDKVPNRPTLPFSIPQTDNVPKVDKTKSDVANNNVAVAKNEIKPTLKSADFGGLFDDEPPDDFFDIIVREQKGKNDVNRNAETSKLQSKTVNLFDSDDDDDDFSRIIGTTTKKDSTASVISSKEIASVVKQDASYSPFNSPFRSPKNNDPPKSYVSFLDDEPVVEDVKHETAASHQSSSRTNLFDDTPPDDMFVPKQKSPTKIIYDDIASTLLEASPSTANLSSNSLRSETSDDVRVEAPPVILPRKPEVKVVPDDVVVKAKTIATEQTPSADPKPDTSSDDVHVEAPPVILPRKPELKVILDETVKSKAVAINKTPVLSAQSKSDANSRDETDQTDQSLSFRKNLSMFSNPVATTLPNVDKETKPKPNKLKTNFNINVAALLPGAKLPSQKQSAAEKPDRTVEPDREAEEIGNVNKDNVTSVSNVKHISSGEDSSGRLVCLGRDRPRIQVQRKPSTRTGRKKLYNKTQVSEDDNVVSSVEATDSVTPEIETEEQDIQSAEPSEAFPKSDAQGTYQDQDSLSKGLTYDEPPPLESNESNSNVAADDDEEDWLKNIDEKPPSPSKTNLYDEDWLSTKPADEAPKSSTQNMSHVMNYDWLTASSLPPEDINPPSNYSIDDDHEQDDWLSSYVAKERSSVVADLPNDDDEWLITAQVTSRGTVAGANRKDDEEVEKDWLLQATLESEKNISETADDDDWLTESLAPPKVSTKATNDEVPVSYAINKISTNRQDDGSNAVESIAEPRQTIRPGLFDSDDENTATDELAGSKLDVGRNSSDVLESKVETKIIRSSTIFDDDDDVTVTVPSYLSTESKSDASKQTPPKINVTGGSSDTIKPTTETKKSLNSTLFDDDDDDDLFASVKPKASLAKQPTTAAVKTAKNVSIKTAAKSSLFSDDDNSDSDDLFGTTTTTKKQKGKIEAGHKPKDKPKKTSLFDDEDDDDEDIFAPKAQKQQRVTQTDAKKKSSVTKSVTTIPASSDPLADLLK